MSGRIRRCPIDSTYTLSPLCPSCGRPTATAHPARFSPDDRRGRYRRLSRGWTR
ncbi:MAG TPA: nucleolar RNA-binding Nop10p family protein [Methanomicrobiales archaeon]|nr:nucleolar RNA-binding Nop10p family protein [Methanomicrobiales archaeon]